MKPQTDKEPPFTLTPIADTMSGFQAQAQPAQTLAHYTQLARGLWLAEPLQQLNEQVCGLIQTGGTAWSSLTAPYGFGKTAALIALWHDAKTRGFLAIPPLSCAHFDELAAGVAALAQAQAPPRYARQIAQLQREIYERPLEQLAQADAARYEVSSQKLRRLLQEKFQQGQLTLDSSCHRLVEFLSRLATLAQQWSHGLVLCLDELQQLLGRLDARAITQFREFVWGVRTERAPFGIILALDSMLEARLANWASDVLHRIRANGPALALSTVYQRDFPRWLWENLTTNHNGDGPPVPAQALSAEVLDALGQFVERPDLANGPRTVVDVFTAAVRHFQATQEPYGLDALTADVGAGRFRYFGEGAAVQTVLAQLLADEWLAQDAARVKLVRLLAVFPQGCPPAILQRELGDQFAATRAALFGPLLVELAEGLALEQLQQVRRPHLQWENILARTWETLPAHDALLTHIPQMIERVLLPQIFPPHTQWTWLETESSLALTGWRHLRGTFAEAYPAREVAVWLGLQEPESWPQGADICFALVCEADERALPSAQILERGNGSRILLRLPVLQKLTRPPSELARFDKFIRPEPFRPAIVLTALHALETHLGALAADAETDALPAYPADTKRVQALVEMARSYLLRTLLQGTLKVAGHTLQQRGAELIRALFAQSCRQLFPAYRTLLSGPKWRETLRTYRQALAQESLTPAIRQGRAAVSGPKAELFATLLQESSTAAGDSLLRVLGPLVQVSGTSEALHLQFPLHPAEKTALDYLRRLKHQTETPFAAVAEVLRHEGYVTDEAREITALLQVRGLVAQETENTLRLIRDDTAERTQLQQKIAQVAADLARWGYVGAHSGLSGTETLKVLQTQLRRLETDRQQWLKAQADELRRIEDALHALAGQVKAQEILLEWPESDLRFHLQTVAKILQETKQALGPAVQKETAQLRALQTEHRKTGVAQWPDKQAALSRNLENLRQRVAQFTERAQSLRQWQPAYQQLGTTAILCAKVAAQEPGTAQRLSLLVDEYRERFAVGHWEAVSQAAPFTARLSLIQTDVQGLIYRHAQTYEKELETLRQLCGTLWPASPAPSFSRFIEQTTAPDAVPAAFQRLYDWLRESLAASLRRCQKRKEEGAAWRAPDAQSKSWREAEQQALIALSQTENAICDFANVEKLAIKVAFLHSGFIVAPVTKGALSQVFDNPAEVPDFARLAALFRAGEIIIRIEPRRAQE